ncbi:MAG TPA: hypothetical protein VGJ40_04640 [Gaiellaceae bacterium]|jgi:hypothetical protein
MEVTLANEEIVRFEVPAAAGTGGLVSVLRRHGRVSIDHRAQLAVFSISLRSNLDLAPLLRAVERWVAAEALRALRFELDGRAYILEAGEPNWTAAVAA